MTTGSVAQPPGDLASAGVGRRHWPPWDAPGLGLLSCCLHFPVQALASGLGLWHRSVEVTWASRGQGRKMCSVPLSPGHRHLLAPSPLNLISLKQSMNISIKPKMKYEAI